MYVQVCPSLPINWREKCHGVRDLLHMFQMHISAVIFKSVTIAMKVSFPVSKVMYNVLSCSSKFMSILSNQVFTVVFI